jgi:hypothetical protein
MILSELLTLASSTAAMCAAIISFFTLFELLKQRKASYKPDLCILKRYFYVKANGTLSEWYLTDSSQPHTASVQLVNIGVGAAKNINANWTFDLDSFIEEINKLSQKSHQNFYIKNEGDLLLIETYNKLSTTVNAKMNDFQFEYLLASAQDPQGSTLNLPPSYSYLLPIYVRLHMQLELNIIDIEIPTLELNLSYSDIGKNQHISKHNVKCNFQMILHMTDNNEKSFKLCLIEDL